MAIYRTDFVKLNFYTNSRILRIFSKKWNTKKIIFMVENKSLSKKVCLVKKDPLRFGHTSIFFLILGLRNIYSRLKYSN